MRSGAKVKKIDIKSSFQDFIERFEKEVYIYYSNIFLVTVSFIMSFSQMFVFDYLIPVYIIEMLIAGVNIAYFFVSDEWKDKLWEYKWYGIYGPFFFNCLYAVVMLFLFILLGVFSVGDVKYGILFLGHFYLSLIYLC